MQTIKKLIGCLTFLIAYIAVAGQNNLTTSTIDSLTAIVDTSSLKLALTTNPPKEGYLLSQAEYYINPQGKLSKIVFIYGNHPGKVNGHLIYRNTYFYYNDEPLKAVISTINFKDTMHRGTYYFGLNKDKGKSYRASSNQRKTARFFLMSYYSEILQKGD